MLRRDLDNSDEARRTIVATVSCCPSFASHARKELAACLAACLVQV